ncbi:hypothetical protein [Succinimonas amylolytica]|uniref:hypothetical protein n=1 Tax=Succinimonas amylolytica TaxID=83769 RepID=UPI0023A7E6E7
MSRILAIMDSSWLYRFKILGSVIIPWSDALEFSDTLPVPEDYLELLKSISIPRRGYITKIFLIINITRAYSYDESLDVSISEVEFLVAMDEVAQDKLGQKWPEFHFEVLPKNFLKGQNYEFQVLDRQARMGAAAALILLGIAPAPDCITEQALLDMAPDISDSVMMGIRLHSLKRHYYTTGYNERTLMSLVISYVRDFSFGYPETDAGFCFDIMDIFHYLVNRGDITPPSHDKASFNTVILNELRELQKSAPDMAILDLIGAMEKLPGCQRIINVFSNLSDNMPLIPFFYLKAISQIRGKKKRWNQKFITGLATWLSNDREKECFATILGAAMGFEKLSLPLYRFLSVSIISDCEDPNTCIAGSTGKLEDENFLNVDDFDHDSPLAAANPEESSAGDSTAAPDQTGSVKDGRTASADNPDACSFLDYRNYSQTMEDGNPELLNVFSIRFSENDQEFDLPEFINTDDTFNAFMSDDEEPDAFSDDRTFRGGSFPEEAPVSAAILDIGSSRKENLKNAEEAPEDRFAVMFPVPFVTGQKSVPPYCRASMDALSQALQITHNMSEISDAELRDSVLSLIETEAPVRREFLLARLRLIARRNKTPFRKGQEELKIQNLISQVISENGYITDSEGFIYRRKQFVHARSRNLADSRGDSTVSDYLRSPENISRAEIAAAYYAAKSSGNLLINDITIQDIIDIFHLKSRGEKAQENLKRIQEVMEALAAIPDIKKALQEHYAAHREK